MFLLSLNVREVGGALKIASVRRLLDTKHPDILFFQETLVDEQKARDFVHLLRPNWVSSSVSSVGNLGGLLVSWDPSIFALTLYLSVEGILLSGFSLSTNQTFALLNLYGPCKDRFLFWDCLDKSGLLSTKHLIIEDDLNIILSPEEAWGGTPGIGFNGEHYKALFNKNNLFDIIPDKLVLTWRNGRTGNVAIAHRLDRFLVAEDIIYEIGLYRSWLEYPFIFDHAAIFL